MRGIEQLKDIRIYCYYDLLLIAMSTPPYGGIPVPFQVKKAMDYSCTLMMPQESKKQRVSSDSPIASTDGGSP